MLFSGNNTPDNIQVEQWTCPTLSYDISIDVRIVYYINGNGSQIVSCVSFVHVVTFLPHNYC